MPKRTTLPEKGRSHGDILADMRGFKGTDVDWKGGRAPLYVFKATDEAYETGRAGFMESTWRSICSTRRKSRRAS
jgi:sphinganine-1-phosphate aldolase